MGQLPLYMVQVSLLLTKANILVMGWLHVKMYNWPVSGDSALAVQTARHNTWMMTHHNAIISPIYAMIPDLYLKF